jgi:D-beta-D-heptose 7-phosphate kinase/D-beta-D-heptose 1-phosphate adenosyltransferase
LDREELGSIRAATLARLRQWLWRSASRYDAIVISDYGKGVVHAELLDAVAELAGAKRLTCIVDPKRENYARYRMPALITPNKDEASEASGIAIRDESTLRTAGEKLLRMWRAKALLITRGPDGMSLFLPRGRVKHFPTQPRDMFDVTGAGDTVVAVCALALACGGSYEDAAVLANQAAGLVGDEVGTVAVSLKSLKRNLKEHP